MNKAILGNLPGLYWFVRYHKRNRSVGVDITDILPKKKRYWLLRGLMRNVLEGIVGCSVKSIVVSQKEIMKHIEIIAELVAESSALASSPVSIT